MFFIDLSFLIAAAEIFRILTPIIIFSLYDKILIFDRNVFSLVVCKAPWVKRHYNRMFILYSWIL
jgi:hypothetical protein